MKLVSKDGNKRIYREILGFLGMFRGMSDNNWYLVLFYIWKVKYNLL